MTPFTTKLFVVDSFLIVREQSLLIPGGRMEEIRGNMNLFLRGGGGSKFFSSKYWQKLHFLVLERGT